MQFFQKLMVLVLGLVLAACGGTGQPSGFQATVDAAASGVIGTDEVQPEQFAVAVSGDVTFSTDYAIVRRDANGVITVRFLSRESLQGVSITLPANVAVGNLDLSANSGVTMLVLASDPSTPTPGSTYNLNPTGMFTVGEIGETISGEFSITVQNETGGTVNVTGTFNNLPIENE